MSANPFEVLRLDPSATEEEIVRQAGRLCRRATDEAMRNAIRQAVQALTARAEDRFLFALLTHAAPCHHWPTLDRFAAVFRRPLAAAALCPALNLDEFRDLLNNHIAEEMELDPPLFEPIVGSELTEEVRRQTAEVLWQILLADIRT